MGWKKLDFGKDGAPVLKACDIVTEQPAGVAERAKEEAEREEQQERAINALQSIAESLAKLFAGKLTPADIKALNEAVAAVTAKKNGKVL